MNQKKYRGQAKQGNEKLEKLFSILLDFYLTKSGQTSRIVFD
jgi:hypothetical protein